MLIAVVLILLNRRARRIHVKTPQVRTVSAFFLGVIQIMQTLSKYSLLSTLAVIMTCSVVGQTPFQVPTSVDSSLLMDAAGSDQRSFLDAVYLIVCPNEGAGTGFLLDNGVVVTNSHVVGGCNEGALFAISSKNDHVKFTKIINDKQRDLALLIPDGHLRHGLALSSAKAPGSRYNRVHLGLSSAL